MSTKVKPLNHCPAATAWAHELERDCVAPRWLAHLEQCGACQRVLEELAAEPQLWSEAQETLADRPIDLTHITESIAPLSMDAARVLVNDPMCEFELAQLQRLLPSGDESAHCHTRALSYPPCEPIARIGRYELEQLIGRGGMGLVFRAWDTQLHRVVAVKTLSMSLWSMPAARERFIREGRAAAMLSHANIVPMYDVINDPPVPALVMQYIAGPTLEEWIQSHGPLDWSHALRIALQLADGLCEAHTEGLVHRDIKPGNVLLEADGTRALLTDFGLVRAMDDATLTQSGLLAGTPHFMSPEQARGEDVDGRSDLFSLGTLIYYSISGQTPFRGRESMSVLNALCHTPHVQLNRLRPEVPAEVSRMVDRLLQKQPAYRPASSQELRDAIRKLLDCEKRLKPKSKLRRPSRLSAVVCALVVTSTLLWVLPYWLRPNVARPPASGGTMWLEGSTDNARYSLDSSMAEGPSAPGITFANPAAASRISLPPPDPNEFDALAEQAVSLATELENFTISIDSRVGYGESLSSELWQTQQELERVQFGLLLPATSDNQVSEPTGE